MFEISALSYFPKFIEFWLLTMLETESSFMLFDCTVLSIFAAILAMDILCYLYQGRAFITHAVWQELNEAINHDWQHPFFDSKTTFQAVRQALEAGWLRFPPPDTNPTQKVMELPLTLEYQKRFSFGRAESMAIALNRKWIFACDDGAAKRFAKTKGICVTGSVGILVKATLLKKLSESQADEIHSRMIDVGYSSPLPYFKGISSHLCSS